MTAYAASEYIQIRNSEGVVKVQHVAPNEAAGVASFDKYAAQVDAFAKPDELIAYLVKNKAGALGLATELSFKYKEQRIGAYTDFLKEIKRTGAPKLGARLDKRYLFEGQRLYRYLCIDHAWWQNVCRAGA